MHGVRLGLDEVVVQFDKVDGDDIQHPIHLTAILPHPTSSYTGFFCQPTISYPVVHILKNPVLDKEGCGRTG